jgi:hypothetical protein
MSVVQDRPAPGFALVADDARLYTAGPGHSVGKRRFVTAGIEPMFSIHTKNAASAIGPYLVTSAGRDEFCGSVSKCRGRQDPARLVEAPIVLAERMIDGRLPPTEESTCASSARRHLDIRHAAHVAGGRKPSHVADDASAERKQGCR